MMDVVLQFDCLSLFPEMLYGFVASSMLGRAIKNGLIGVELHNIRDWAEDKHHITDDAPFGGGAGMVMRPEPIFAAINELKKGDSKVIYPCPDGEPLTSSIACELAAESHLILLSGHYEGVDQRVRDLAVDREISIGDYVLTNGTLASAVLMDAVSRYVPGVLGSEQSLEQDSFSDGLLSFPQYTRPAVFMDVGVPDVLLSGNHGDIASWRHEQRVMRTRQRRPDLLKGNLKK
ncbi:MAG: tRNA (guanosine(37)-N1)-methyltransferase TrmD [Puniceicoccales bacterium]|jgi:tRNA (guanine37-N1)-methyltransferase|nr:tRNA (guanosine(37)-N1)-methyltransferase TrmD [Puniceicoccales bacterium]